MGEIQFSQDQIIQDRDQLLKIFGKHAQTDQNLHTIDGLINLFDLVAFSAGHDFKQIPFPAIFLPCGRRRPPPPPRSRLRARRRPGRRDGGLPAFMTPTSLRRRRRTARAPARRAGTAQADRSPVSPRT